MVPSQKKLLVKAKVFHPEAVTLTVPEYTVVNPTSSKVPENIVALVCLILILKEFSEFALKVVPTLNASELILAKCAPCEVSSEACIMYCRLASLTAFENGVALVEVDCVVPVPTI